MRVCFISHSAGRYGAELALLELLQGLAKEGVDCKVLVPEKGPLLIALDELHVEWRVIGYPVWMSRPRWLVYRIARTLKSVVMAVRIAHVITRWRCDIVYTNTVAVGAGAFAAWLARRPHIWHLHESGHKNPSQKLDLGERRVARLMDHLSAAIIVNSRAVENDYTRYINSTRMRVIYQSVTLRDYTEKAGDFIEGDQFFLCVIIGSLHAWKGQNEAIIALSEVVSRGINAHLLIVGDGEKHFRAALCQQVIDLGLGQRVKFHGYAENPMPLIWAADVILVCSRWEAFGRVTVEAMLAGKPVIGSANGGTTELIQDGETGLLYESGNHSKLADKIQYLYEHPKEKERLGNAACVWATDRFAQKRYAKEVRDLLGEVLAQSKLG